MFEIDKTLKKDTHYLFESNNIHVLLHKNATIPWIILVPITQEKEVFNLPEAMQISLNNLTKKISQYFISHKETTKMNSAAIGNIVSQLHIHVIGRNPGDACWPDVVWGRDYTFIEWSKEDINHLISALN